MLTALLILSLLLGGTVLFVRFRLWEKIESLTYNRISSPEDLLKMSQDPSDDYILTSDIDMSGYEWIPFTFSGVFDGNGHTISNLQIDSSGTGVRDTYDGNMKVYSSCFAAFFDVLDGGKVRNVNFENICLDVTSDTSCFAGSIAGYMSGSTISNCSVNGSVRLCAHDRMFGVGGICGYGNGMIRDVDIDIVLICTDTDRETKDEQFMGGICSAGYPDIINCNVQIDGYDSEHGYAHNGGLIGMYMFYPEGMEHNGSFINNCVIGKITFYEDNEDRRAYCEPFVGEMMDMINTVEDNRYDFKRDEVYTYDVELLPE